MKQWSSAAAKVGGEYTIAHSGTGRLYSTGQVIEAVNGRIINGVEGRLEVDIPVASTCTVVHRARVEGEPLSVSRLGISTEGDQLDELTLGVGPGFPRNPAAIFACYQGEFYEMRQIQDRLTLDLSSHKPGLAFLQSRTELQGAYSAPWLWRGPPTVADERNGEEIFKDMLRPLLGQSFGLRTTIDPQALMLGPEVVRLLVYTEMTKDLEVVGDQFPDQWGFVLYVIDIPTRE